VLYTATYVPTLQLIGVDAEAVVVAVVGGGVDVTVVLLVLVLSLNMVGAYVLLVITVLVGMLVVLTVGLSYMIWIHALCPV
jgi:hypothetical protein